MCGVRNDARGCVGAPAGSLQIDRNRDKDFLKMLLFLQGVKTCEGLGVEYEVS